MEINTQNIWRSQGDELFFFILKRIRNEEAAREILQNSFLKIHKNLPQLRDENRLRAWVFQIVRNEIVNFYKQKPVLAGEEHILRSEDSENDLIPDSFCCFEKFIADLPEKLHLVVEEVYLKGKSQQQTAEKLGLSLANTKARIRRAKNILKQNFQECCKYQLDEQGQLTGEPDCGSCA